MNRWCPDFDDVLDEFKVKLYARNYAVACINEDIDKIFDDAENGRITEEEKVELLSKICPDGLYESRKSFRSVWGERLGISMRCNEDSPESWKKYFRRGEEKYIEQWAEDEKYGKVENAVLDHAEQEDMLGDKAVEGAYYYGMIITTARLMRRKRTKDYYFMANRMPWSQLSEYELVKMADIMEKAEIEIYKNIWEDGQNFVQTECEIDQEKEDRRFISLVNTIVECIYRMYLCGNADLKQIKRIVSKLDHSSEVMRVVREKMSEYIQEMTAILDKEVYPVDVVLQMLGYPAMSREEYEKRMTRMKEDVGEWEHM